jgi:hypothetical protein
MMRRDQEGRQLQGLRTMFKPLEEWYGKNWRGAKLVKDATTKLSDGIKKAMKHWKRCVEVEGDSVEK